MTRLAVVVATIFLVLVCSGCSVYMAANQPGAKDLSLLNKGQPRAKLIAEFGQPIHSELKDGVRKDIFQRQQGYHSGVRAGHATANVATLGLREVVGTPVEGYMNGTQLSAEVAYDRDDRGASITPLKGERDHDRQHHSPGGAVSGTSTCRMVTGMRTRCAPATSTF